MTFEEIAKTLTSGHIASPHLLADYRSFCGGHLFQYHERYGKLRVARAGWITANRENFKSYAECDRAWESTETGKTMLRVKARIEAITALTDAMLTTSVLLNREAKQQP